MIDRRGVLALAGGLAVSACAEDTPEPPVSFEPQHYDYLTPIRLNVASVEVEDRSAPSPLAERDPDPPAAALRRMAADRLQALGPSGRAVFTITEADIARAGRGTLAGAISVRLDIIPDGASGSAAFASASVVRTVTNDGDPAERATLFGLTTALMAAMNVELEFQARRSLRAWMLDAPTATPTPVEQAPLPPPAS